MDFLQLRLLLVLILFISCHCYSNSWVEGLQSTYDDYKKKITEKSDVKDEPLLPLPTDAPEGWMYSHFKEPVLNSTMVVLQAGIEHQETILLVHGLGQLAMKDWYSVIPHLAEKYHVIAIDLPGFGLSQKPDGQYTPTTYAKILKSVTEEFSKSPPVVVGHSMGGAVSLRFASMYPKSLSKLILVDAAGILHKTAFIKGTGAIQVSDNESPEKLQSVVASINDLSGSFIEAISDHSISKQIEQSGITWALIKGSPNINAAFSLVEEDFSEAIIKVDNPTYIIWGELDRIAPLRTGKVLKHHIAQAQLSIIPEAGHVPMKSHNEMFLDLLDQSLNDYGGKEKAQSKQQNQGDLSCNNLQNIKYSGAYEKVTLNRCHNIELVNFSANELFISDSLVSAENINIESEKNGIVATESVITITNGSIRTKSGIKLTGSRLDIAGVNIIADENSIMADVNSKLVFSVSHIKDKFYVGHVHGAYKLNNSSIAQALKEE